MRGKKEMLLICGESRTMSYYADAAHLVVSEKLVKASPVGHVLLTVKYLSCGLSKLFSLYPR